MPRSVNSVASRARRKKILSKTRGNFLSRKNVWTVAKNTYEKGLTYAYRDRKAKKREFRSLWIQRINAAARQYGLKPQGSGRPGNEQSPGFRGHRQLRKVVSKP